MTEDTVLIYLSMKSNQLLKKPLLVWLVWPMRSIKNLKVKLVPALVPTRTVDWLMCLCIRAPLQGCPMRMTCLRNPHFFLKTGEKLIVIFFCVIYLHWLTCWRTDYPKLPIFNVWHTIFKMTINQSFVYLRAFCWFRCALDFYPLLTLHHWRSRKKFRIRFMSDSFSCTIVILKYT